MARMKAYTLGIHGFISVDIREAIGAASHHRQARVIIVARTKAEAINAATDAPGVSVPAMSDSEFRVTDAAYTSALIDQAADQPAVFVHPIDSRSGDPVVRVDSAGPHRVGRLDQAQSGYGHVFIAEEA